MAKALAALSLARLIVAHSRQLTFRAWIGKAVREAAFVIRSPASPLRRPTAAITKITKVTKITKKNQ